MLIDQGMDIGDLIMWPETKVHIVRDPSACGARWQDTHAFECTLRPDHGGEDHEDHDIDRPSVVSWRKPELLTDQGEWIMPETRSLSAIAAEVRADWRDKDGNPKIYFGAVPYLQAMDSLDKITDRFGEDPADDVVIYFLSNARTWRGATAKRVKAELQAMLKSIK